MSSAAPCIYVHKSRDGVSFRNTFEVRLATRLLVIAMHVYTAKIRPNVGHRLAEKFHVPGDLRPLSMFRVLSR